MRLYLIRHGETEDNVRRAHQGWTQDGLNEHGVKQAEKLRDALSSKHFDRIICSDLGRTRQTCRILFGEDATVEYDERLREINNTVLHGRTRDELYALWGDEYLKRCHRLDFSAYGGESAQSLLERTADFMCSLEADTISERIAAVTHGGTIRAILSGVLGCPIYTPSMLVRNCSISELSFTPELGWRLLHLNNTKEI